MRSVAADPAFANLNDAEAGIVVDLFLSFRAVEAHQDMIDLYHRMPAPLQPYENGAGAARFRSQSSRTS